MKILWKNIDPYYYIIIKVNLLNSNLNFSISIN